MQQRSLGSTGLKVSRLGLGTMTWGRDTDEHEARDQLVAFVEAGGTLVDTAAGYGDGASEELIGSLLGDVVARDEVVLATKAGISAGASGRASTNASRGHLLSTLDASLQRLGVDHVDLWQVHTWVDDTPLEETLVRARLRGDDRPGVVRRRLATTPAGRPPRPRPGSAPCPAGRRWPRTRWSTPCSTATSRPRCCPAARGARAWACCPGRRWAAACSPASTAPAPRPTPAPPPRTSRTSSSAYLDERARRIVEAVARAADGLGWSPLEVALAWVRDRPGRDRPDRRRPHRRPAARRRWASRS